MQNSKEQQGEIRKPSSMIRAKKKQKKTIEWERLESSSRKLEIAREHGKMGTIKDRNSTDLTEAEDIRKRWQEYTEKLSKKDLHDPDNHVGLLTQSQMSWNVKSSGPQEASL